MRVVAAHFAGNPTWLKEHDYLVYAKNPLPKGFDPARVISAPLEGNADYDRLTYLIDNYDDLPDTFLLTKSNLFKYITEEEFDSIKDNKCFTPVLTQHHKTQLPTAFYDTNGMYWEINNSWYLNEVPAKRFRNWGEWAREFNLPDSTYIPFAPGGNYILTRDTVHKHPKRLYEKMRSYLPWSQTPGEAQLVERSYFYLWR